MQTLSIVDVVLELYSLPTLGQATQNRDGSNSAIKEEKAAL